jgi:hypothetical protein
MPASTRNKDVFPQPFGPVIASFSEAATAMLTPEINVR